MPSYLAHWSSRAKAAATYEITDSGLRLSIPPEQGLWCPDTHPEPLRVSCIQSASFSGPVGSTQGPQPFRDGLTVREAQPAFWGYAPKHGRIEVSMKAHIDEASMFAFWLSGIEDQPERSGEICVAEVFGSSIRNVEAEVGLGVHRFRDPQLMEAFTRVRTDLDTAEFHDYRVDWSQTALSFFIDGELVHRDEQSPDYPMQLMIGVFDFPAKRSAASASFTPEMTVARVTGAALQV